MSRIIGLDLSLTDTGLCRLYDEGHQTHSFKSKKKDIERLIEIKDNIYDRLYSFDIDLIVIEGYGFSSQRGHSLGELGGVVKVMLKENYPNTPILLVPPTVLKKFITGKGNGDKSLMLLHIYKKYNVEFSNHNEADAFALAKFGEMYLHPEKTKVNLELSKKVIIIKIGSPHGSPCYLRIASTSSSRKIIRSFPSNLTFLIISSGSIVCCKTL